MGDGDSHGKTCVRRVHAVPKNRAQAPVAQFL
jgi:hypothetical protein